mmetsp:Transcript_9411/g.16207  ORF Transcript_9411/g.16207 Transcript_9411/m.16207 type:complete len:386 (-) Transcript_9411:326-1483(-)
MARLHEGRLDGGADVVGRLPGRTAEEEVAVLLDEEVPQQLGLLLDLVLDVDLLLLVSREGDAEVRADAALEVIIPLVAVEIVLGAVAAAEEQHRLARLLAHLLLVLPLLRHGPHGRQAGSEGSHDDWHLGLGRHAHAGGGLESGRDVEGALGELAEVVGAGAVPELAARGLPVHDDDAQLQVVALDVLRRRDRVVPRLQDGDHVDQVRQRRFGRGVPTEDVHEAGRLLQQLGVRRPANGVAVDQSQELLPLVVLAGELGQSLVEPQAGPAEDVEHVGEQLEDGAPGWEGRLGLVALGDELEGDLVVRVQAVPVEELLHLLGVVARVDGQRVADRVLNFAALEVEHDVADVALVVERGDALVAEDLDVPGPRLGEDGLGGERHERR